MSAASSSNLSKPSGPPTPRPPEMITFASLSVTPRPFDSPESRLRMRTTVSLASSVGWNSDTVAATPLADSGSVENGNTDAINNGECTFASSMRLPAQRARCTTCGVPSVIDEQSDAIGASRNAARCANCSFPRGLPAAMTAAGFVFSTRSLRARPDACGV